MGSGANEGAFLISRRASSGAAIRLALIALLLAAWGLLLYRLDEIPPGFQHDQMFNTMDALDILQGHHRIYFPANFGREPLGMYLPAGVFTMVGDHFVWGLRFSTVMCGLLSLALTVALARRHLPAAVAWFAAALMAGSFWFLFAARLGLEPMVLLPLTTAMCYFLSRGMARSSVRDLALAGIAGGAGLYAYPAGRPLILMMPLLVLHRFVVDALERKRAGTSKRAGARPAATLISEPMLRGLFLATLLMALIGAPLFVYIQTHPAVADARLGELQGPILAALRGDVAPLLGTIREGVLSILWAGPDALPYQYNIPGRPALQPILACFFLLGLTLVLLGWRRPDEFVLLLGLLLGLLAVLLTGADALYVRGIVALPLLFILAARGAWWAVTRLARLLDRVAQRWPRAAWAASAGRWLIPIALGALLLWHVAESSRAYFVTWAQAEPTQRIYNADFRAAVALADALPPEEEVYIGSDRNLDLDRRTYQLYGPRRSDVQWFYLPGSPPLPRGSFGATYLLPQTSAELPPALDVLALAAGEQSVTPARRPVRLAARAASR